MSTAKIFHRSGGEITAVTHIGHETYKGVADWFFVGDVKWQDGTESKGLHIGPYALCHDDDADGKARVLALHKQLNDYLEAAGEWHDDKHKRDGRVYRWTPKAKAGQVAVSA